MPALLLLAAGASTRLGSPKQLVKIGEQFLLEKMVETALATPFRPVVVVLGAHAEIIRPTVDHLPVEILQNDNWESGMASSITCGVRHLVENHPDCPGLVLMLSDQPFVTQGILQKLHAEALEKQVAMAAAHYGGTFGPPAYFSAEMFGEMLLLQGQAGAKKLFAQHPDRVAQVDFPEGADDLDTPEDVQRLLSH